MGVCVRVCVCVVLNVCLPVLGFGCFASSTCVCVCVWTALLFLRSFLSTAFLALFLSRRSQRVCLCESVAWPQPPRVPHPQGHLVQLEGLPPPLPSWGLQGFAVVIIWGAEDVAVGQHPGSCNTCLAARPHRGRRLG